VFADCRGNTKEIFPHGLEEHPFVTLEALHSCEDFKRKMLSASSMPKLNTSSLQDFSIVVPNFNEGEDGEALSKNLQKIDSISRSGYVDEHVCYCIILHVRAREKKHIKEGLTTFLKPTIHL